MTDPDPDTVALLREGAMFSALGDAEVAQLLRQCLVRDRPAGEVLFLAGQEADRFFVVLAGKVKVFQVSVRGDEQILHLYGPGNTFGEAAMWAGGKFPAHAEAVADTKVLVVPRQALRRAIEGNPDLAMGMLAGLSAKLREFNRLIEDLSLKEVPARLARVLLEEAKACGRARFKLRQTKRQLAAQIGTVAETLSRALGKLKEAGLIAVKGSEIRILDAQALADLVETG